MKSAAGPAALHPARRGAGPASHEMAGRIGGWVDLDNGVAHPARVYDYWLGGKDNFAADRAAAKAAIVAFPGVLAS
ncbi:MAG TPA: SAM-dependent methyltransferase [Streptosporangiaceae bacterium]|nr:SAM-dependent methyltransferase [Streptosporangiaceae bacterium]